MARFQVALREDGLDGALVVQETDLYYLSGTGQSAHLVVPAEGDYVTEARRTDLVLPRRVREELEEFFVAAGAEGRVISFEGWDGPRAARACIRRAAARYARTTAGS